MENQTDPAATDDHGLTFFVVARAVIAVAIGVAVLWAMTTVIGLVDHAQQSAYQSDTDLPVVEKVDNEIAAVHESQSDTQSTAITNQPEPVSAVPANSPAVAAKADLHGSAAAPQSQAATAAPAITPIQEQTPAKPTVPLEDTHSATQTAATGMRTVGVALVEAIIEPLDFELNERFWGWRPNDLINITDNINNLQLGVLETTRRAVVQLAQRISRTGSTDAFDRNLENAMSWIMTKATDYWFPSPESRYRECLEELKTYKTKLAGGNAYFYTRADNLIPLFEVFEDLLGSCDQNLVKQIEADGTKIGFFKSDDYFYYAKGVAHAMATILSGVQIDFSKTMDNRRSGELLHHAIESCRRAAEMEPWMVTNADLDGILANHRANIAAPISHARYYLGQLIITLST